MSASCFHISSGSEKCRGDACFPAWYLPLDLSPSHVCFMSDAALHSHAAKRMNALCSHSQKKMKVQAYMCKRASAAHLMPVSCCGVKWWLPFKLQCLVCRLLCSTCGCWYTHFFFLKWHRNGASNEVIARRNIWHKAVTHTCALAAGDWPC